MLTLLLLVLAAPNSAAAPSPKPPLPNRAALFVVAKGGAEEAASGTEGRLLKALDESRVSLVDLGAIFPAPAADLIGQKLMKEAKEAYDNLDYDAAAARYHDALEHFGDNPAAASAQALGEANYFSAVIALQTGGKKEAKHAQDFFAKALIFDPNLEVDVKTYGADLKKAFDKAAQDVSGRAQVTLKVESTPSGAEARLRGKALGLTPIERGPSVPAGRHLVTFTRPGFEAGAAWVDASRGETATAGVKLKVVAAYGEARGVASTLVTAGFGTGKVPAGAHKVAEVMKSRFLLVASVGEGGAGGLEVWDVESGSQLKGLGLSDDASLLAASKKVKEFMANPSPLKARVASADASEGVSGTAEGEPLYKKWWFWPAVGVVVVGAAAGVAVGVATAPHPQPFNPVLGGP